MAGNQSGPRRRTRVLPDNQSWEFGQFLKCTLPDGPEKRAVLRMRIRRFRFAPKLRRRVRFRMRSGCFRHDGIADLGDLILRQIEIRCACDALRLSSAADTDNRARNGGVRQGPGNRDFAGTRAVALANQAQPFDELQIS
jgi:hypothetical protein